MKTKKRKMVLNAKTCDRIASVIIEFCKKEKVGSPEAIRYRLSAEMCLLKWISAGFEGQEVVLQTGIHMFEPFFMLEMAGDPVDPYENRETDEYGYFFENILVSMQLKPEYVYKDGKNQVLFRLKRKSPGQLQTLGIVITASVLIGVLGLSFFPDSVRLLLLEAVINPLYETFFKLLGCVGGPMIFLSVLWGILGIGDVSALGRIGRRMMAGSLRDTFLAAAACLVFFPLLGPGLSRSAETGTQFHDLMGLLEDIFPSNIVEPFTTGNTLQIIFLSFVIAISLLYLGDQAKTIGSAVEQLNLLVKFLMESLTRFVPLVIFLVILNLIWSGDFSVFQPLWKLFLALGTAVILLGAISLFYTSWKQKVKASVLMKKAMPVFLLTLSTASSAAAMGMNMSTCEEQFGIDPSITGFGLPLGTVIYKPTVSAFFILLVFFNAEAYDIPCSPQWLLTAIIISTVIAIATPPVPGGGAVAIAVLFKQMNIPSEAMAVALMVDMLTDFPVTAVAVFCIQMFIINLASGFGLIDKKKLRSPVTGSR